MSPKLYGLYRSLVDECSAKCTPISRLPIDPPSFGPKSVGTQLLFSYDQGIGYLESFHVRLRDECLNTGY